MTAVEWFIEQIKEYDFTPPSNNEEYVIVMPKWIFNAKRDEGKEMEKQQIIDAWHKGYNNQSPMIDEENCGQTYYNETYGSKGSDDQLDILKEMFELEGQLIDSYPVSEKTKPHSFCETPEEKCTMSYCDENGCINRKRNLVEEPLISFEDFINSLKK